MRLLSWLNAHDFCLFWLVAAAETALLLGVGLLSR